MPDETTDRGMNQNLIIYVSTLEHYEQMSMFSRLLELSGEIALCLYNS